MNQTLISQYAKKVVNDYLFEFYNFIFSLLNNLIDTDIDENLKLVFINSLINEKTIFFFKDKDELQIGRLSRVITRDNNYLPLDVEVRTLSNKSFKLLKEEYVIMYNPLPIEYLKLKIDEIANIEKITLYLRKLYKTPIMFKSKDTKVLRSISNFIKKAFDFDEPVTIVQEGIDIKSGLEVIKLDVPYITDKLLDENESLKEDILEILGIYKNTSGNRERVNEAELVVSNSLTTVNKLGIENTLNRTFKKINDKWNYKYNVELNINKIFDSFGKKEEKGVEE